MGLYSAVQLTYDLGGTAIMHDATIPAQLPFAGTMSCDAGQLIPGGLRDSARHGELHRSSFTEHWYDHP